MTYQFCQCNDNDPVSSGLYFIEKVVGEYQRTDRADTDYVLSHFKSTGYLYIVTPWDENCVVSSLDYVVLLKFNDIDELLSTYPELFL